ncbi:MAG: type II toxin-antitoxin system YafQ family toxin [Cycloclasticus sp.]|nr:type II toxin-antitoxin system YafQ family toxin [Cycloclasticus sp.]
MHKLEYSNQFKKDFKKITKQPIPEVIQVGHVISTLQRGETLGSKYTDHGLTGDWLGYRDCHVKPDLVLIYKISLNVLKLARIGSHSELFK